MKRKLRKVCKPVRLGIAASFLQFAIIPCRVGSGCNGGASVGMVVKFKLPIGLLEKFCEKIGIRL